METVSFRLSNRKINTWFEVEEILEIESKQLDISATADRSDSLSIQGFHYEIAAK
jgi:Iap family predicted aminopeptidase